MPKKLILIIEDEKILLDLYASVFLRQEGGGRYEVHKAQSCSEAHNLILKHKYDFILSDYHLPDGDGITLIKEIKQKSPSSAVVLISGYLTAPIVKEAIEAGIYTSLKKPCSIKTLLETAEKALEDANRAADSPKADSSGVLAFSLNQDTVASAENKENFLDLKRGKALKLKVSDNNYPLEQKGLNSKSENRDFFFLVLDEQEKIVYLDQTFLKIVNLEEKALLKRPIRDFLFSYFWQYLAKQEMNFLSFAKQNQNRPVTLDFVCGEEKIRRPLLCEFVFLPFPEVKDCHLLIIGMDMGKRLELYRLIEFERESLKQLSAGQFDMVFTVDNDFLIKTVNNLCLEKLKARLKDLVGDSFLNLLARPKDKQIFEQAVKQAKTLDHVYHLRCDLQFKGQTLPVLININTVRNSYNEEVGYVLVVRDISRQLKMEATLRSVERMQALGQLAAGTAHQINNYTNTIMGSSELLEEFLKEALDTKTPPALECLNLLNIIHESIHKLNALTQHLTSFARAQQTPVISAGDVNSVIRDIFTLVGTHLRKKQITLEICLADNLPQVFFSPLHLEQALLNIIMNAIDAVAEGKGKINITTTADKEWVYIYIKDNGPGIPEEIKHEIFEAFVTTKPPGKGTGLGLNIARDVIESIKGTIEFESCVELGTTMKIKLPILANSNLKS